jgi:hypothetical protein
MIKDNTSHYINQAEISSYLFDVRKYNALTRDEETELIKKMEGVADFYLPEGKWTSLITGESVVGGSWRSEKHGYTSLPLYVRESSLTQNGAELNPLLKR